MYDMYIYIYTFSGLTDPDIPYILTTNMPCQTSQHQNASKLDPTTKLAPLGGT